MSAVINEWIWFIVKVWGLLCAIAFVFLVMASFNLRDRDTRRNYRVMARKQVGRWHGRG